MSLTKRQKEELEQFVESWLKRKVEEYSPETQYTPFLSRIIRDKKILGMYSFTHSVSTSFGMSIYEQITKIIASENSDIVETQWCSNLNVAKQRRRKIQEIITELGNRTRKPDRKKEEKEILSIPNKDTEPVIDGQIVDVYIKRGKEEYYIDIKTVKPNIPGFLHHKNKILTWIARADKPIHSMIALPYNPYHPQPYARLSYTEVLDPDDILVGKDFWDLVGGKSCYEDLLSIFNNVGKKYWRKLSKTLGSPS